MDFFDATINRTVAYLMGTRNMQKALLMALLEPSAAREVEAQEDFTGRLAAMKTSKI